MGFFQEYYGDYTEIVYYEYEMPTCSKCDISMNSKGYRPAKPNKWERIRKKNNTSAQNVEKHISQVWKISSKDTPIIHVQFAKNH